MAPTAPKDKPSARALRHMRVTGQIHPLLPSKVFRPDAAVSDDFLASKRDKRLMKHSSFVSRITSSRVSKPKRRRPSKKLRTNLDSLADALPDLGDDEGGIQELDGKIRHRSLKSKRGALKRKERIVRGEMERFGVSMARLADTTGAPSPAVQQQPVPKKSKTQSKTKETQDADQKVEAESAPATATSNRWAALRGYISATMEQNPAFTDKA